MFLKSGRAALFVDQMLWFETRVRAPRFTTWAEFRDAFKSEFCPKNKMQMALAKLETPGYFQAWRSVDDYVDKFHNLINTTSYQEGLAIVIKFRRGLQHDIQDQITQLPYGWPADDDPNAWYSAMLQCTANWEANATFHGIGWNLPTPPKSIPTFSALWPTLPTVPPQQVVAPIKVEPGPVPMDVDATQKNSATPVVCYRCRGIRHMRPNCLQKFNIRFMTMEEKDEWMQEVALAQDIAEVTQRADSTAEDFVESREWKTCPPCL